MNHCRICGDENNVGYRERSDMVLCQSCHVDTPAKVSYQEFLAAINQRSQSVLREFYSDYKTSRHSDPVKYWQACSK